MSGGANRGNKKNAQINFKYIADVCLTRSETLASEWLPDGVREGPEWSARNPIRNDQKRGSFKVNLVSGKWSDFASGEKGGDFISLYAYLHNLNQLEAARELADKLNVAIDTPAGTLPPGKVKQEKARDWLYVDPVPENAPPAPVAHTVRGKPDAQWVYRGLDGRLLGYIWRFTDSQGGKEIIPLTLWKHAITGALTWRHAQFPEPRPLYGLERMQGRPDATVLIVEGEKCADVAHDIVGDRVIALSWPGGGKAVAKADFSTLKGRNVVTWADCDGKVATAKQAEKLGIAEGELLPASEQPGVKAMRAVDIELGKQGCKVRNVIIPAPGAVADGWDIADAVQVDGWDAKRVWEALKESAIGGGGGDSGPPPDLRTLKSYGDDSWRNALIWTGGRDPRLHDCRENVYTLLKHHPELAGLLQFDPFAHRVALSRAPPGIYFGPMHWNNDLAAILGNWFAQREGLIVKSLNTISEGARMVALENPVHPILNKLKSLKWDKTPRLDRWLTECVGCEDSAYSRAVSRMVILSMVARIFQPGCHMRAVMVLLGPQNLGKSKVAAALGAPWNADTAFDLRNKDTFQMVKGIWVYEISELDAFSRADQKAVKGFISSPSDRYRPPYAPDSIDAPRQVVFVATANRGSFIRDNSGGTRYWPIKVKFVDIQKVREIRDQLLAEAIVAYEAGEKWWPEDEALIAEFTEHQDAHTLVDPWFDKIARWVDDVRVLGLEGQANKAPPWESKGSLGGLYVQQISEYELITKCLAIEIGKVTAARTEVERIEGIMEDLGFEKVRSGRMVGKKRPYVWQRVRESDTPPASSGEVEDVPF